MVKNCWICMKVCLLKVLYLLKLWLSYLIFWSYTIPFYQGEKLGDPGADWWVPDGAHEVLKPGAICYLAGVGENSSFDLALIKKFRVHVFAFDPTPRSIAFIKNQNLPSSFRFYPWGIWTENGVFKFFSPQNQLHVSHSMVNLQQTNQFFKAECKTIESIMRKLGHTQIDLLKLDIEGAEFTVLPDLLMKKIYPRLLCVEFDQPRSLWQMIKMVIMLQNHGYHLINQTHYNFTFIR